MKGYIIGKILVVLIFISPVFFVNGCKKQEKCGCDGDILYSIGPNTLNYSDLRVSGEGSSMSFMIGYDTYYFCNPVEMYEKYKKINPEDQILISGDLYWDCNYVSQSSQSSYYYYYKYYNINVTELKSYLYGK
ncbi:MAG: hypothetical protein NT092_01785 [Bacteroidia bacterium]|nr:hypothetical protein [Bacteroidia bacterium]